MSDINLNMKAKIVEYLKGNIRKYLPNFGVGKGILARIQKALHIKENE